MNTKNRDYSPEEFDEFSDNSSDEEKQSTALAAEEQEEDEQQDEEKQQRVAQSQNAHDSRPAQRADAQTTPLQSVKRALGKQLRENGLVIALNLVGYGLLYVYTSSFARMQQKDSSLSDIHAGLTQEMALKVYTRNDQQDLLEIAQVADQYLGANYVTFSDLLVIVLIYLLEIRLFGGDAMEASPFKNTLMTLLAAKDLYNVLLIITHSARDFFAHVHESQSVLEFEMLYVTQLACPALVLTLHKLFAVRLFYAQKALRNSAAARQKAVSHRKSAKRTPSCCRVLLARACTFFYPHAARDQHYRNRAYLALAPLVLALPQVVLGFFFGSVLYLAWTVMLVTLLYAVRVGASAIWSCVLKAPCCQRRVRAHVLVAAPTQKKPIDYENWVIIVLISNAVGILMWFGFGVASVMRFFFSGGMVYCNYLRAGDAINEVQQKLYMMRLLSVF